MKNTKSKLILGIIFLIICFLIFIGRITLNKEKYDNIQNIFIPISLDDSLNNCVLKKYSFNGFKYTPAMVFLKLDNDKVCKIHSLLNPIFSNMGINDILEEGDKLKKLSGSDTIFIIKKNPPQRMQYYVLLKINGIKLY